MFPGAIPLHIPLPATSLALGLHSSRYSPLAPFPSSLLQPSRYTKARAAPSPAPNRCPSHPRSSPSPSPAPCPAAIPLYQSFSNVFPGAKPLLAYVMRNYKYWALEQSNAS